VKFRVSKERWEHFIGDRPHRAFYLDLDDPTLLSVEPVAAP
jgi:hypothetical protein